MHILSKEFRMNHTDVFTTANLAFIGANTLLGIITLSEVNIVIAAVGGAMTILANADRVAYSIARIMELKRNKWRIPKSEKEQQK